MPLPDDAPLPIQPAPHGADTTGVEEVPVRGPRRRARAALAGLAAALMVAVPVGVALGLHVLRGTGDAIDSAVPDGVDVYATAYLDPSLGQKMNLQGLLQRFPATRDDSRRSAWVDTQLERLLKPSGLSYARDVRPWLGTQIAMVGEWSSTGSEMEAVLVSASDDGRASAALDRFRQGSAGARDAWSQASYRGVTIWTGRGAGGSAGTDVVDAVTGHTVVLASDAAVVRDVIDTVGGRHRDLASSPAYRDALTHLPSDRLGILYVPHAGLVHLIQASTADLRAGDLQTASRSVATQAAAATAAATPTPGVEQALAPYGTLALAVSAQGDGVQLDTWMGIDRSRLPASMNGLFTALPHVSDVPAWVPADALGFLDLENVRAVVSGLAGQAGSASPGVAGALDQLGITGGGGLLDHLGSDAGLAVLPRPGGSAGGVLLLQVDNADGVTVLAQRLAALASCTCGAHRVSWRPVDHGGVTINVLSVEGSPGVAPAYAVTGGMAVVGTSTDAVAAALDAERSGHSVRAAPAFTGVSAHALPAAQQTVFVDVRATVRVVRALLSPADQATFDRDVAPNLAPVASFLMTTAYTQDGIASRSFIGIG